MRVRLCAILSCALVVLSAPAQPPASDAAKKDDPMAVLAPFVGEWRVNGKWSNGETLQARGVYEWGLGKKILIAKTFVGNGDKEYQRYESIMTWHPKKKSLYEISFAFDGSITEVLIEPKDRHTFHIGFAPFHSDQPANLRQVLKFKDNDHFVWTATLKQGDEWKQLIEATWERTK
ncbi:MAG TPA: hypothetical protein VH592_05370 [Gemmataceae bacterium]|jgi:hypothetical protein